MEIKLVKNEDIHFILRKHECFKETLGYVTHNRDYVMSIDKNKILGFAILFDKENSPMDSLTNVVSLSNIEVDEDYTNRGIATKMLNFIAEHIKENNKILKRTSPTEDGKNYIYNKFTQILKDKNVPYIPDNLDFIYSKLESNYFKNKTLSNEKKIKLLLKVSEDALKGQYCKKHNINSLEKLNSNFLEDGYEAVEKFIQKEKRKNKIRRRK